jgi:hypothetical protein
VDDKSRTVAFVLYPGLTPLDMIGPLQVFNNLPAADPRYEVTVVGERIEPMLSDCPVKLVRRRPSTRRRTRTSWSSLEADWGP